MHYYGDPVICEYGDGEEICGVKQLGLPMFLQAGNGSCLYGAVDRSVPSLSADNVVVGFELKTIVMVGIDPPAHHAVSHTALPSRD